MSYVHKIIQNIGGIYYFIYRPSSFWTNTKTPDKRKQWPQRNATTSQGDVTFLLRWSMKAIIIFTPYGKSTRHFAPLKKCVVLAILALKIIGTRNTWCGATLITRIRSRDKTLKTAITWICCLLSFHCCFYCLRVSLFTQFDISLHFRQGCLITPPDALSFGHSYWSVLIKIKNMF